MPRIFTDAPNELRLNDNISGGKVVLFYRMPSAKEQAEYTNGMTRRDRNKLVNCTGEQRQKYGKAILSGFREGDFLKPGREGDAHYDVKLGGVRFSSDPNSTCHDPAWKDLVAKFAPDLIEQLAIHAFERTAELDDGVDLDNGGRPD
jgi:hypothetical protein